MFEDSLIESGGRLKTKRGPWMLFSTLLHIFILGILILIPLIYTDALPRQQLMTFLVAPPPTAAPTATTRGRSCGQGSQDPERLGKRSSEDAHQDS